MVGTIHAITDRQTTLLVLKLLTKWGVTMTAAQLHLKLHQTIFEAEIGRKGSEKHD